MAQKKETTVQDVLNGITEVMKKESQTIQNAYGLGFIEHLLKEKFVQPQSVLTLAQNWMKNTDTKL